MSEVILGKIIKEEDARRDAIHVAVVPVQARENLMPGIHVGMVHGQASAGMHREGCIGIVDPFLEDPVSAGEFFWLLLYPKTVRNLRHEWDHDELEDGTYAKPDSDDYGCRGC